MQSSIGMSAVLDYARQINRAIETCMWKDQAMIGVLVQWLDTPEITEG